MANVDRTGLVTPEAVVLEFQTASIGSRLLAITLDLLAQGGILVLGFIGLTVLANASDVSGTIAMSLSFFLLFLALFGYPVGFETLWNGRTPGKAALGLRVVTKEGAPIRFRHAAIRGALQLIDFYLSSGAGAVVAVLVTRDNQRLGDLAAGTIVLRERSGARAPTAVRFPVPYGYEGYAATLDTSALTEAEYGAARSFLLRAAALAAEVRWSLAVELATPIAARLHHTPPPGVTPEAFLACVAASYQARYEAAPPPAAWGATPTAWGPSGPASGAPAASTSVWARAGDPPADTAAAPPAPSPPPTAGGFQAPG